MELEAEEGGGLQTEMSSHEPFAEIMSLHESSGPVHFQVWKHSLNGWKQHCLQLFLFVAFALKTHQSRNSSVPQISRIGICSFARFWDKRQGVVLFV